MVMFEYAKPRSVGWVFAVVFATAAVLTGCSETKNYQGVRASGFLGDYSMLRKGGKGEAEFVYRNPSANWKLYDKIQLDPVTYWRDTSGKKYSHADMQGLANRFYRLLHKKLSADFKIVQWPEVGAMRLQVAITDVDKGEPVLDKISTVLPITAVGTALGGNPQFTGTASVEAKITDAITGELLIAGMDRRVGGKRMGKTMNTWKDVAAILEFYSSLAVYRLCTLQARQNCVEPT